MRKTALFALLLAAVVVLAPAGRCEASVVKSVYGPTICTWSDALAGVGNITPDTAVVRLPDGSLTTVPTGTWTPDGDAEAWSPGLAERLDALLGGLVRAGLDPETLRGLEVYALPAYTLALPGRERDPKSPRVAVGVHREGAVVLAGLWINADRTFFHELGHHLADRVLGTAGYWWPGGTGKRPPCGGNTWPCAATHKTGRSTAFPRRTCPGDSGPGSGSRRTSLTGPPGG
jgi:hypothetical protein